MTELSIEQTEAVAGGWRSVGWGLVTEVIVKTVEYIAKTAPSGEPSPEIEYLNGYHAA